jgi:hypothetical protein
MSNEKAIDEWRRIIENIGNSKPFTKEESENHSKALKRISKTTGKKRFG